MASSIIHYADIYDPEEKKHSEPRWSSVDQRYRYYEGYGQGLCQEKEAFLVSINRDHELWSGDTPETREVEVFSVPGNHQDGKMPWSRPLAETQSWNVGFRRESDILYIGEGSTGVIQTENIDDRDRNERLSWNFSKMLADYCEKAHGVEGKKKFFLNGGVGETWSKNKDLMKEFGPMFERINDKLADEDFKIALSDQSVKDYPRHIFKKVYERYQGAMKSGSRLNAGAPVFIPGGVSSDVPKLVRCDPQKICGAYVNERPIKPAGPPPPRRPIATTKDSNSRFAWEIKQESDSKIENLEKKLDLLIQMNGPIVNAEIV